MIRLCSDPRFRCRREPLFRIAIICLILMFVLVIASHHLVTIADAQENEVRSQYNSNVLATHEEKISELKAQAISDSADRALIHKEISDIGASFNELNLRMATDETKITTAVWLVGAFIVLSQGVWVFLHIADRLRRPRSTDLMRTQVEP